MVHNFIELHAKASAHRRTALFFFGRQLVKQPQELAEGRQQRYDCVVDILIKIKRLAIARRLRFTFKADTERIRDGLSVEDIVESLVSAPAINKILRSRSANRLLPREKLYVIISSTYDGTLIYTKGTIRRVEGVEEYYLLISTKKDTI